MKTLTIVNEFGLSQEQMGLAKQLIEKHEKLAQLAEGVLADEVGLKTKYVQLCDELRKSGMNGKELTLLLIAKGHKKTRVSEIKKICSLPQEVFDRYLNGDIGRNMAIKIARTGQQNVDEAKGVNEQPTDPLENAKPVSGSAVNLIPEKELSAIKAALKKTGMALGKHVGQVSINGRDFNISIVIKVPVTM